MKKNHIIVLAVILLAFVVGLKAQALTSASPYSFAVTGVLANCPPASASTYQYCFTTTGMYQSLGTTTWSLITGGTSGGVQTVNGVAPGTKGNVTVACSGTTPLTAATVAAPVLSVSGGNLVVAAPATTVPNMVVTNVCSGTGS